MIPINKQERNMIVERFPNVHITRTMRQDSKRGHYFCVEDKRVMRFLDEYRRSNVMEEHWASSAKGGDKNGTHEARN